MEAILDDLGLGERLEERIIEVLNKIDLLDAESRAVLRNRAARSNGRIPASALNGAGLPELLAAIGRHLAKSARTVTLSVALDDGAAIAWLYDRGQVLERRDDAQQAHLRVELDPSDLARFRHRQADPVGGDS